MIREMSTFVFPCQSGIPVLCNGQSGSLTFLLLVLLLQYKVTIFSLFDILSIIIWPAICKNVPSVLREILRKLAIKIDKKI